MARRVLQLAPPVAGGMAAHLATLLQELPRHGFHPLQVSSDSDSPATDQPPPSPGAKARSVGPWPPGRWPQLYRALTRATGHIDLIHAHGYRAALLLGAMALTAPPAPRLVVTLHGFPPPLRPSFGRQLWSGLWQHLCRHVHGWIVVSEALRQELPARARATRIYNGVDWARFDAAAARTAAVPEAERRPVVLTAGRLAPEKGHRTLLKALSQCRRFGGTLWVAGSGPLAPALCRLTSRLELSQKVQFLGFRDDLPALMRRADIFVLASRREGLSNALIEAMGSGLVCLASRTGGMTELLAGGRGFLVPPADDAQLARSLDALLARWPRSRASGRKAWRFARQLTASRMVRATAEVYEEALKCPPTAVQVES